MTKRIYGTIESHTLTAKTFVFHPVVPFRITKHPFLGRDFQERFLGVCVHVFQIIRTKKLEVIPFYSPRPFQLFLNRSSRSTLSLFLVLSEFPRYDNSFISLFPIS